MSERRKVNVAVVGLGFMGATHLKAYGHIRQARLVAVCDGSHQPVHGVLRGVRGNLGRPAALRLGKSVRIHGSFDAVLADREVDLVDLCVPTPLHHSFAIAALGAGKHVLCEKPMARTSAQARAMIKAARNSASYLMPAMCLRFWPEWSWLKRAVEQGTYGRILAARFRRVTQPPLWNRESYFDGRASGGALLDLHIHDADFIHWIFGRPRRVCAAGQTRFSGAIDHVIAQYQVARGAVVSAEASWLMHEGHGFGMAYTVNFERATADYDSTRGRGALRLYVDGKPPRVIHCAGPDGYAGELRHLIHCILSNEPPSIVTAADGLVAVELCEAAERSVRTGRPIAI